MALDREAAYVRTLEAQVATLITQTTSLQTRLTSALRRIATLEARDPEPQEGPAEAGSSTSVACLLWHERDASKAEMAITPSVYRNRRRRASPTQTENALTLTLECQPKISRALKTLSTKSVAYTMPLDGFERMITDKYCPRGEIKKLESEYWNLKLKVESMSWSPDQIHGSVKASNP
ncbi:hypothetical protein Tco_0158965 [Tanacetum coccineum]